MQVLFTHASTMQILINYEVDAKQTAMRDILKMKGYEETWRKDNMEYQLPSTSLWKGNVTPSQAIEDLKKVARALNVELLGASAIEFTDLEGLHPESATSNS